MRAHAFSIALITLLALPGCDKPDVGARCQLTWNADGEPPPPTPLTADGEYFESGNVGCDDLVCIVSPAPASSRYGSCSGDKCGYCSKPCVSDRDCYSGETGLKCLPVVLDEVFIATLEATNPMLLQRYLGDIRATSYCVVPR